MRMAPTKEHLEGSGYASLWFSENGFYLSKLVQLERKTFSAGATGGHGMLHGYGKQEC